MIREYRLKEGLSQKEFAEKYGIPVGSLRNWEQGHRKPPAYVVDMLKKLIAYEKMINEMRGGNANEKKD